MLRNNMDNLNKKYYQIWLFLPKRQSTSNQHQCHADITLIRRRPNFDEFPRHFHILFGCNFDGPKFHVVSTYCFGRNFDGPKIQVVSTYFFWCNFSGRNIHVVSTHFFQCNFDGRKIYVVFTQFSRRIFDRQKFDFAFGQVAS